MNPSKIKLIYFPKLQNSEQKGRKKIIDVVSFCKELQSCSKLEIIDLDFGSAPLGDEGLDQIIKSISLMKNLQSLTLQLVKTSLGDYGVSILAMALPLFNVLRSVTLNFNKNQIKDSGIKTLGFQISKCYELKELKLKLEGNKITELGCLKFVENISKCTQLQEIFLSFREINLSGETSDQIFKHLEKLINLQTLSLILIECIIKDIDVQKLANCLKYLTFLTSLNLNLSQNLITSEGILALGEVISQQQIINQLKLYLCNNPITAESLNELYKKICSLKNLEKLIIDQSKIQFASDQEIQIFQETLSNTNKIQYLYIKITGLENRSTFINMMKSLQNCQCLDHAEFIFSDNKIQDEDLIIFGESLSKLQSLSSLTLMIDNNKIQTGILEFLTLLHYCGKLSEITLDLSFNRLSQDTIYKLSKSIRKFQKILSVFILIHDLNLQANMKNKVINQMKKSKYLLKQTFLC